MCWIGFVCHLWVWDLLRFALRLRASRVAQTKAMMDRAPTVYSMIWILLTFSSSCDGVSRHIKENSE